MEENYDDEPSNSEFDSEDESTESDEESESEMEEMSWKHWFLTLRGNEFFCEVDDEYIEDDFNLTGLSSMVPYYDYALDVMLDVDISLENLSENQRDIIDTAAEILYGLIHARFVLTARGMDLMHEKYLACDFGRCPRVCCNGQPVLPIGQSDVPRVASVNVFCPKCQDAFYPRSTKHATVDGAFFGTTFCHLYLLNHPSLIPAMPEVEYVPRIYGFKIHESSPYKQQRMLMAQQAKEKEQNDSNNGKAHNQSNSNTNSSVKPPQPPSDNVGSVNSSRVNNTSTHSNSVSVDGDGSSVLERNVA